MTDHDPQFDTLPEPLVRKLRAVDEASRQPIPPQIDRAILDQATAQFASRAVAAVEMADKPFAAPHVSAGSARWMGVGPWGWGAALAAAVVVGVLVFIVIDVFNQRTQEMLADLTDAAKQPLALQPGSPMELAWDVDQSGRLDVLDVLILAQRQARGDRGVTPDILADLSDRIVSLDRVASGLPIHISETAVVLAWLGEQHAGAQGGAFDGWPAGRRAL